MRVSAKVDRLEDALATRPHPQDLAALELELLALLTCDLRPELLAVAADELDPHLEAEVDDAVDHGLVDTIGRLCEEIEIVGPRAALTLATGVVGIASSNATNIRVNREPSPSAGPIGSGV